LDAKQIEQMSLFSGLDKRERAREGNLAYEFFVIREGTADVDVGGEVKYELGPDDFFGEIGDLRALGRDMTEVIDKLRSACYDRVSGGAS
jgi:CRP-like cAMP-binding protein